MRFLILITALLTARAHAAVATFDCTEPSTGLHATGKITQSSSEQWRFFIKVTMDSGASQTLESRYYYGYDVDGSESFTGYSRGSTIDYRETDFRDKPDTITLDIKKQSLTGDNQNHQLICGSQ